MIHLKPPNKGDDIKADLIRDMIKVIQHNKPIAGNGLISTETEHGTVFSFPSSPRRTSSSTSMPRTFDIESASTAGKMKLMRCYFQISDKFIKSGSEPEYTPQLGTLYAVINTSVTPPTVTAQFDFAYNPATPEQFPFALYEYDGSGNIICDLRGSQVVMYA